MRVQDLLKRKHTQLVTVDSTAPLKHVVRLFIEHHIGGLPVVNSAGTLVGFVAERDVVGALHEHPAVHDLPVETVMRPAPICQADQPIEEAMRQMTSKRQRHLLVKDGDDVLGVISVGDIVKYRLEQLETETGVLRDYVAAQRASMH
jgi:CBS domain-containing protein